MLATFPLLIFSCISRQVEPTVDCSSTPIEASVQEVKDSNCGKSDGAFSIAVSGGETPFIFTSDLGESSNGAYSNVIAGNHSVVITDSKGCSNQLTVSIKNSDGVNLDDVIVKEAGCDTGLGSIEAIASGGEEPYTYSLNGGTAQQSNMFPALTKGEYDLLVMDALGCETSQRLELLPEVRYENSIKEIIQTSCAIPGCHNGSQSPDFRSFATIQLKANRIMIRTGDRTMPDGGGSLTQAQIDMIACWVEDGALDN